MWKPTQLNLNGETHEAKAKQLEDGSFAVDVTAPSLPREFSALLDDVSVTCIVRSVSGGETWHLLAKIVKETKDDESDEL